MATKYDFQGPGVARPHPKKNWVNPDAKQVHFASGESRRSAGSSRKEGSRRSILPWRRRRSG